MHRMCDISHMHFNAAKSMDITVSVHLNSGHSELSQYRNIHGRTSHVLHDVRDPDDLSFLRFHVSAATTLPMECR